MRLFLAIDIPDEIKEKIIAIQNQMKNEIPANYVERENLHITLKFIGEVKEIEMLDPLHEIGFEPFKISLSQVGVFPNEEYIRVIWIGIDKGADQINRLHQNIESKIPFERSEKYHPHITIARVRSKIHNRSKKLLNTGLDDEFEVKKFILYKSTLTPSGPVYQKLASYPA